MSTSKSIDRICILAVVAAILISVLFMNGAGFFVRAQGKTMGYEDRLFDISEVHTIDIVIDDWDAFLQTAQSEAYSVCSVVIDGEAFKNVGIRGKGNTSLSTVSVMDSDRYSFKIEFDQYDSTKTYYGLDKLGLNNLIQDNTMMKDYLTYQMMNEFGVAAPLSSFVYITVNGEDWGLYLAVETGGTGEFAPFLISLPWDGDTWNLDVKPERDGIPAEIPQTGDKSVVVISSWVMAAAMLGLLVIGSRKKY